MFVWNQFISGIIGRVGAMPVWIGRSCPLLLTLTLISRPVLDCHSDRSRRVSDGGAEEPAVPAGATVEERRFSAA